MSCNDRAFDFEFVLIDLYPLHSAAGTLTQPLYLYDVHVRDSMITGGGWGTTGACGDYRSSFVNIHMSSFITCINNGGKLSGGMYIKDGHVKATSSTFNKAFGSIGGAMLSEENQNSEFTDCVFEDNEATCCGGVIDDGGTANTTFTNCIFRNNKANEGALYYGFAGGGTRFINSVSYGSEALSNGGLFFFSSRSRGYIDNFTGYDITAAGDGGVYRHASAASFPTLINSRFENIFATKCSAGFTQDGVIQLQNVSYKNMTSVMYGGLCLSYSAANAVKDIVLDGVVAAANGALTVKLDDQDIVMSNITIKNGDATLGGGIYVMDANNKRKCLKLTNAKIETSKSDKGTIYLDDACIEMTSSTVIGNKATRGSLTYFAGSNAKATYSDVSFTNNQAKKETTGKASLCGGAADARGGFYFEVTQKINLFLIPA